MWRVFGEALEVFFVLGYLDLKFSAWVWELLDLLGLLASMSPGEVLREGCREFRACVLILSFMISFTVFCVQAAILRGFVSVL